MDLWPENPDPLPHYTRFDTVPRRNHLHTYHDRHQTTHYSTGNHGELRNPLRESSYWTLPRLRIVGTQLDRTNWTEPQRCASTSVQHHLLGGHPSQQNIGECECCEAGEWRAAAQPAQTYERDYVSEGWHRGWEPTNLVRYRDSSTRCSNSYRELEAWATRYSHSLPRRRRIEAELRGGSVLENRRSAIEPCMAALQQVGQCPNQRHDPRPKDRAVGQQKLCAEADQVVGVKGNIQRRMFTQPPGYVAPPPYNSPSYQASAVMPNCLTQVEKIQDKRDRKQNTCSDFEGYSYQKNPIQIVRIPQTDLTTQIIRESSSKVIEGRTFRFNKRTGGMTIFCLVSRIASPTENPSLTPSEQASKTEGAICSSINNDNIETAKVADEVDKAALTLLCTEKDRNVQHIEGTESCIEKKLPEEGPPKKDQPEDCLFKESENKALSILEKQATQSTLPVSARYPLWREPSFISKIHNQSQLGMEVRRLDVKKSSETEEEGKDLLVIDTTCVVVKMEVIKSPMMEQVHMETTMNTQHSSASSDRSSGLSTELNSDQSSKLNLLPTNEHPANGLNSDGAVTTTTTNAPKNAEIESLEKRAECILGINIQASSLLDMCVKDTEKRREHLPQVNDNEMNSQLSKNTTNEKQSEKQQNQSLEGISDEDKNLKVNCDNSSESHQKVFHFLDDTKLKNVCQTENPSNDSTQEVAKPEQISTEIATENLTPPPFCCNNSLPEANQDPERESSPNFVLSPLAVQSLTVFESETTEVSDNDSVLTPNPIQQCSTQLEAVTLLQVASLLDSDEPPTLPSSPDKKTSTAMADTEVCEEDETEKEKASPQDKLSDVACDSSVIESDILAAHQQLQSEAANEAIPGRSHNKPTAFKNEQPFLIQAKDRNETNNSGNSEKVMEIQSDAKVETLANLAQDVHTKKVNAESDDNKDFPGLKEHTQECQKEIVPTTKPFLSEDPREALPKTSSPPIGSREDIAPQPERESACPSNPGPPVGPLETLPALLLDHTPSENSPFSPPTPPLPEESKNLPPDLSHGAELQYPASLWDAVNRIRKHTAPDSENEEDEVFELWDPDNVAANLDNGVFEEPKMLEVTKAEQTLPPQPFHEEDTLSCSSASSHNSEETIIIADEDYVEETEDEVTMQVKCNLNE
ncbi:uncharacterized protein LOC144203545 [Stigmatopora nigra]